MRKASPLRPRFVFSALLAVAAATAMHASLAQTVYKSTLPDGHVVYGSKPEKGAAKVEKMEPKAPIVEVDPQAAETQRQREKEQAAELGKRLADRKAAREKAEAEIFAAKDALTSAEKALATGKEPLPGERLSTADGGSKLTESYNERVKVLDDQVKAANERLDKAYRDRGALN